MEVIYSVERVNEERVLMYNELLLDFETVPENFQALAPRLDNTDSEDFQGTIHYSKGQLFLEFLESAFGRAAFDEFLSAYFTEYAFGTITTEQFLDYLDAHLLSQEGSPVTRAQAELWTYGPGLPEDVRVPVSRNLENAKALAAAWSAGEITLSEVSFDEWSPQAKIHFINSIDVGLSHEKLAELDAGLGLSTTSNAEIARTWFIQVAKRRFTDAYEPLQAYLKRHGRGRLITPVYEALAANGEDLELAQEVFAGARDTYHPIAQEWIAGRLFADEGGE